MSSRLVALQGETPVSKQVQIERVDLILLLLWICLSVTLFILMT